MQNLRKNKQQKNTFYRQKSSKVLWQTGMNMTSINFRDDLIEK